MLILILILIPFAVILKLSLYLVIGLSLQQHMMAAIEMFLQSVVTQYKCTFPFPDAIRIGP